MKRLIDVPFLPGTESSKLLNNPSRGLRLEVYMNPHTGNSVYAGKSEIDAVAQLDADLLTYAAENVRLAQVYFYITEYKDRDLDAHAFENMERFMQALDARGIQAVLRFAYIWDDAKLTEQEASPAQMLRHIAQLAPFLAQYRPQIMVLQAGMIGAWGEWAGGDCRKMDALWGGNFEKALLTTWLENMPDDLFLQVRYSYNKTSNFTESSPYWNRIGYHDDFLVGKLHEWNTAGDSVNTDRWRAVTEDSRSVLVDGELIWGHANDFHKNEIGGLRIDPFLIAWRLYEHHFTSLSLAHNYLEGGRWSMCDWQQVSVRPQKLREMGLPFHESWFYNENGNAVSRSMFEYIRDHLGYYLVIENAALTRDGSGVELSCDLINVGFAAPLGLCSIALVSLSRDGDIVDEKIICEAAELQPMARIPIVARWAAAERIGLRLQAWGGTEFARIANQVAFVKGINILA